MVDNIKYNHYKFFTDVANYAKQNNCHDLSLGLPDFDVHPKLKLLLQEAAANFHHYEPLQGNEELIESLVVFNKNRRSPIAVTKDCINIIPCSTFGLYTALKSILKPYDEVIVFEPCYYTYNPIIEINGGIPKRCILNDDYSIDFDVLKDLVTEKTKAIIVNTPHNPSGRILTKSDWDNIYGIVQDKDIYIISEEVYDNYIYDNKVHYSPMQHECLKNRTFSIFSFGKMFHITGWKISYMLAYPELLQNFRNHQQYISYGVNAPAQHAVAKYLTIYNSTEECLKMENKRNLTLKMLENSPFKIISPAEGAFYQIIDFSDVKTSMDDLQFADYLLKKKSLALLPLSAFYTDTQQTKRLRLSFTRSDENLELALIQLLKSV